MRGISKEAEPVEFTEWKAKANANWQPTFENLNKPVKPIIREALRREQRGLCAYCERPLSPGDEHIEHVEPQSDPNVDPLDYGNFVLSCQDRVKRGDPLHCGMAKGYQHLPVTPLQQNCSTKFTWTNDGRILPAEESADPANSIDVLRLDIPKLNALRRAVLDVFDDPELSLSELQEFLLQWLLPQKDERDNEFPTMIRYLYRNEILAAEGI